MVYTYLIHIYLSDNVSYVNLRHSYVIYGAIYCVLTNLRYKGIIQLGGGEGELLPTPRPPDRNIGAPLFVRVTCA